LVMKFTEIVSQQIAASVVDQIHNSEVLFARTTEKRRSHKSMPWVPIVYTSMKGWLFLNYLAIVLFGILVGCIAYIVMC
jgi:hypothetical protein